jgi:hypothetical protein
VKVGRTAIEQAKDVVRERASAYQRVFADSPVVAAVLDDLAEFCRAHKSTFHRHPRVAASLDGRREVWLRIERYSKMTPDEIWELIQKERGSEG